MDSLMVRCRFLDHAEDDLPKEWGTKGGEMVSIVTPWVKKSGHNVVHMKKRWKALNMVLSSASWGSHKSAPGGCYCIQQIATPSLARQFSTMLGRLHVAWRGKSLFAHINFYDVLRDALTIHWSTFKLCTWYTIFHWITPGNHSREVRAKDEMQKRPSHRQYFNQSQPMDSFHLGNT